MQSENGRSAKSIRFVHRIYFPKVIGFVLAVIAIFPSLPDETSLTTVIILLVWGFLWPHLAYQLAIRAKSPARKEIQHLYIDAFVFGAWVPLISFSFVPSMAVLSMHLLSLITIHGIKRASFGFLFEVMGIAFAALVFGFNIDLTSDTLQVFACIPVLVLYPLFVGHTSFQLANKVAEKQSELVRLSRVDGLTGLYNRRYWENQLDRCFRLNQREETANSIIFVDIDHFKNINDTYGHIVGDAVLQNISEKIQATARETDICCRYGGEEFCILLPQTNRKDAQRLAERLRLEIEHAVLDEEHEIKGSISLGVAEINDQMKTYSDWLTTADQALYEAKSTGRNRTAVASD